MAESSDRPIIIIKKKKGAEAHHGGAWKVAMADFMSTMFALFLTLWILGQNVEVKKAVANYFRHPMEIPGNISALAGGESLLNRPIVFPGKDKDNTGGSGTTPSSAIGSVPKFVPPDHGLRPLEAVKPEDVITNDEWIDFKNLVDKLWKVLGNDALSSQFEANLQINAFENGLVVQIIDVQKAPLLMEGSRAFSPPIKHLFKLLAQEFSKLPNNQLEIDGHETGDPGLDPKLKWQLSAQMADDARTELRDAGIKATQITKVAGCADARLLDPAHKEDRSNRRISIVMRPRQWVPENY